MNPSIKIDILRAAGQALADARVNEAESFLRHRINAATDGQAKAMAVVETHSEVDICDAEYQIAKAMLQLATSKEK